MRFWAPALAVCIIVAACSHPTPTTVVVTVAVPQTVVAIQTVVEQQTVVVRETVEVPVTVVVTATPKPTATPVPEPSPQPTAAVAIPKGWQEYKSVSDRFSTWYPPEWKVNSEDTYSVGFDIGKFGGAGLLVIPESLGPTGDEAGVNQFVEQTLKQQDSLNTVRVLNKGSIDSPLGCDFVEMSVKDYVYENVTHEVWFRCQKTAGVDTHGNIFRVSGSPTKAELENLTTMLALVEYH